MKLNHIGIAVADLKALKNLFSILGCEIDHVEKVADQGVNAHFIPLEATASNVELLEAVDPKGTIAQFISKRGPGIHHLSFELNKGELEPTCHKLRAAGIRLIYDQNKNGAHGMKINFIHPSSAGGVLIELMEPSH